MKKRRRHTVTFTLLRPFFRIFLKLRYNLKAHRFRPPKGSKGPYLILSNHTMELDPFTLGLSFKEPIFYVASDIIFSIRFWSFFIKKLAMPIPKTKYRSDIATIRDIKSVVKSGGSIGIFPEGNATFKGSLMEIPPAIAKLVKLLGIPVLFYNIKGGYLTNPRWGKTIRKGYMESGVKRVFPPEEYQDLTPEEIQRVTERELTVDDIAFAEKKGVLYKGKDLAEYFESAYFHCPLCGAMVSLESERERVRCLACGFTAGIDGWGRFHPQNEGSPPILADEWYEKQKAALPDYIRKNPEGPLFQDGGETVLEVERSISKKRLGSGRIALYPDRVRIDIEDGETVAWPIEHLDVAVQQRNKLIIHNNEADRTLYLLNPPRRNALKYVLTIEYLKKER